MEKIKLAEMNVSRHLRFRRLDMTESGYRNVLAARKALSRHGKMNIVKGKEGAECILRK